MTTMELEAQKAMLAREILNTDNSEFLQEMSKAYHRIKARMQKEDTLKQNIKEYPRQEEESCSSIVNGSPCQYTVSEMQEHLEQSRRDIKAGRCYTQEDMKKKYGGI